MMTNGVRENDISHIIIVTSQHQPNPPVTNTSGIGLASFSQGKHFSGNFDLVSWDLVLDYLKIKCPQILKSDQMELVPC